MARSRKALPSITDQLRAAIAAAEAEGDTRYAIAKRAGVSRSLLTNIMAGKGIPRLDTAEAIVGALGGRLGLTVPKRSA